jgi:hypothetical protein
MQKQPPYRYAVGAGAGQLVNNEAPYWAWSHFCSRADAEAMLATVKDMTPDAELVDYTNAEGSYVPSGRPNPDNVRVWAINGSVQGKNGEWLPILEYAGSLIDRKAKPQDGVDNYPLTEPVKLVYSASDQGLVWVRA